MNKHAKVGDIIYLSDKQAIEDSMKAGLGPKPLQFTVKEIITIKDATDLGTWTLYFLSPVEVKQELLLVNKIVDALETLRLYYQTDFKPGSREDILERGDRFLFQPPSNPNDFRPNELKFTVSLTQGDVEWERSVGELHGTAKFSPPKSGLDEVCFASLVEYHLARGQTADTELLLLELGTADGSLIRLFAGCDVNPVEIEVFSV